MDAPRIVIDPFAGGITRGLFAARAGYLYIGIDASPAQVEWNTKWARDNLTPDEVAYTPVYKCTDGGEMPRILREVCEAHGWPADTKADMMLTCPPYWVKEVYEGDPAYDLSHDTDMRSFNTRCANILMTPAGIAAVVVHPAKTGRQRR